MVGEWKFLVLVMLDHQDSRPAFREKLKVGLYRLLTLQKETVPK